MEITTSHFKLRTNVPRVQNAISYQKPFNPHTLISPGGQPKARSQASTSDRVEPTPTENCRLVTSGWQYELLDALRPVRPLAYFLLAGGFAFPLAFASIHPRFWLLAPVAVACWAMLALAPVRPALAAMASLFTATLTFYLYTQRDLIVWGLAPLLLLSLYQSLLTLLPAIALRRVATSFPGLPLAPCVGVTWVAGEFARSLGPLGLPSGSLSLPLSETPLLMQTADLGGTTAVAFPVACLGGLLAEWTIRRRADGIAGLFNTSAPIIAILWAGAAGYGAFRLIETRDTISPGQVIGIVQPDAPTDLTVESVAPKQVSAEIMAETRALLARTRTADETPPALIVWPESPGFPPLNPEFLTGRPDERLLHRLKITFEEFALYRRLVPHLAKAIRDFNGPSLLYGSLSPIPDTQLPGGWRIFNAASLWHPDGHADTVRQNKIHLAPFGEHLPGFSPGSVPRLLECLFPNMQDLSPGKTRVIFSIPLASSPDDRPVRFCVLLCNESLLASTAGIFHSDPATIRDADFLVVMANESSLGRGELPAHAARICSYRAIEARVGIVRAAHTGISGFYRPDGIFHSQVRNQNGQMQTGMGFAEAGLLHELSRLTSSHHPDPQFNHERMTDSLTRQIAALREQAAVMGSSVGTLFLDRRANKTLYTQWGDWLGVSSLVITIAASIWPPLSGK